MDREYVRNVIINKIKENNLTYHDNNRIPYGYIYLIFSASSNFSYIGQRKLALDYSNKSKGWRIYLSSGVDVRKQIKLVGEKDIIKMFICYVDSKSMLDNVETMLIKYAKGIGLCQMNHAVVAPWPNNLFPEENLGAKKLIEMSEQRYISIIQPIEKEIIYCFLHKHYTISQIHLEYGVPKKLISKCLHRNNIDTYRGKIVSKSQKEYIYQCSHCKKTFILHRKRYGKNKYCSRNCASNDKIKISSTDNDYIKRLYLHGLSLDDISHQVGVSHTTIEKRLDTLHVKRRNLGKPKNGSIE